MTLGEVIQALRDSGLHDDAETNIASVRIERGSYYKVQMKSMREDLEDKCDEG